MNNDIITIEYTTSVFVQKGAWRSEIVQAKARLISEKMAEVIEVISFDGQSPTGYISRTGSKSQTYNASGVAKREIGKKKRLSTCKIIA